MGTVKSLAQDMFENKIKELISHEKTKTSLKNLITELDNSLIKTFEGETYFSSLDRYVHNGTNFHDVYGDEGLSAFYCSLICAFFDSDDGYLGKTKFPNYHWNRMNKEYSDSRYDEEKIKRYFLHCYTAFKEQFSSFSSSEGRTIINSIIESINDTVTPLGEMLKQLIDKNESSSAVESDPAVVSRSVLNPIRDDNGEYQELYQDTLFLEAELDDNKKATLKDTYVKPRIASDEYYNFDLEKWIQDRDSRILLLYGKAGIGKTSFVSWLAFEHWLKRECHILKLRDYIGILNSSDPWESVKECFKCEDDNFYKNSVLILDGLDEVCVLNREFNGYIFVENLRYVLKTGFGRHIKVVITSRMGYFNEIVRNLHIEKAMITWDEASISEWCDSYCNIHTNRKNWQNSFKKKYSKLNREDKRREVFCSPIILYICCVSQINIYKHSSVASIYDEAFRVIGKKEYHVMNGETEKEVEINRQFTKEIAFQMFLNGKLDGVLESDWVNIAKEKTIQWGIERYGNENIKLEFKKLFTLNHFAFNNDNAVEFAHKTVGEYFTAIKFYEDYFKSEFDEVEGKDLKDISLVITKEVWRSIFNAFRYKEIPQDIMTYLVELIESKQSESWKQKFFKSYYMGLAEQFLVAVANEEPKYEAIYIALIKQIQLAFRNLTWLLTMLGFKNNEFDNTKENLAVLSSYLNGDVCLDGWRKLEGIDLSSKNLEGANFSRCSLNNSFFKYSRLGSSTFWNSSLNGADFSDANLEGSNLGNVQCEGADFRDAYLCVVKLKGANFEKAKFFSADLQGAEIQHSHFENAQFLSTHFENAQLQFSYFENAQFPNAHFENAQLQNSHFENANFANAHFETARLQNPHFERAQFIDAHFGRAQLEGAHFEDAKLQCTHFEKANLKGSFFLRANLKEARFNDAHLERSHFEEACLDKTCFINTILDTTHFEQASFEDASFDSDIPMELTHVFLLETDLPKLDKYVLSQDIILFEPIVITGVDGKVYNPVTNRMEIEEE